MSDEFRDPRFEASGDANSRGPVGRFPVPDDSRLRTVSCRHCSEPFGITGWVDINGFLVVCPHCHGYHGKPWGIERTVVAGLFFNALSFFFTMRPRAAFGAFLVFVAVHWGLLEWAARDDMNATKMVVALASLGLGPMLINAALLVRHQTRLDQAPPGRGGSVGA